MSAQRRLRNAANALDRLPRQIRLDIVAPDSEEQTPELTAAQLRLVADLLGHPTWGTV